MTRKISYSLQRFTERIRNLSYDNGNLVQTVLIGSFDVRYMTALAFAPLGMLLKSQFFRPMTNGFIARSLRLLLNSGLLSFM
jgi:hypothetical protein